MKIYDKEGTVIGSCDAKAKGGTTRTADLKACESDSFYHEWHMNYTVHVKSNASNTHSN